MKIIVTAIPLVACLSFVALGACSKDDPNEPGAETSDASADTSTGGDAATAKDTGAAADAAADVLPGGACNALTNTAPESTSGTVKGNAPTATGGTITDGTYYLSEFTLYDPNGTAEAQSPSGLKVTLSIKGNLMESIQTLPGDITDTFAETFVVSGTSLDRTLTCPKKAPDLAAVYSVDGKKLTIYETDSSSKLVAGSLYVKP